MGRPGGQPFGSRSLPSQLLICRCTKPFDRKENYNKQHLMIFNTWPFPGFPCPVPVFLYPFPVLPRDSSFSQRNLRFSWKLLGFPGKLQNFREHFRIYPLPGSGFPLPNSGFTQEFRLSSTHFRFYPGIPVFPKKFAVSGHFQIITENFPIIPGNFQIFLWNFIKNPLETFGFLWKLFSFFWIFLWQPYSFFLVIQKYSWIFPG